MNELFSTFYDSVRENLNNVERRVKSLKAKVESDLEAVKATADGAARRAWAARETRRDDAEAARANMKARQTAMREETEDRIAQWKLNRQIDRLEERAKDAEDYAAWSLVVVIDAIAEADLAVMEAIVARLDADSVAGEQ